MARKVTIRPAEEFTQDGYPFKVDWAEAFCKMLMLRATGVVAMRAAAKVCDKVEAAGPSGQSAVILEEAEYQLLKAGADGYPWAFGHRVFLAVHDDIDNAVEFDLNAPTAVETVG